MPRFEQNRCLPRKHLILKFFASYLQLPFLSYKLKFHSLFNNLQLPVKMFFLNAYQQHHLLFFIQENRLIWLLEEVKFPPQKIRRSLVNVEKKIFVHFKDPCHTFLISTSSTNLQKIINWKGISD